MDAASPCQVDRAQALADLQIYVRKHHTERDTAILGRHALDNGDTA
jgi:hypothetical protein